MATGYPGTGAERLRGSGDFIAITGGRVSRFQAAYLPAQVMTEVVGRALWAERNHWAVNIFSPDFGANGTHVYERAARSLALDQVWRSFRALTPRLVPQRRNGIHLHKPVR
jgi:hypothetical protein